MLRGLSVSTVLKTRNFSRFSTVVSNLESPSEKKSQNTRSKRRERHISQNFGVVNVHEAIEIAQKIPVKFDETVEIAINTGLDPRKPGQNVKGIARLPFGNGKKSRVCVIASIADAKVALENGADVAGGQEVIAAIQKGDVNYTAVIATPDMMPQLGKIGKILGPRGLMPNPKVGTVTTDIAAAVRSAKAGAVQFKAEKKGIIHAGVGKVSFTKDKLLENIRVFMISVMDIKPEGVKGKYLRKATLSTTMGPSIEIDLGSVDPSSPRFLLNVSAAQTK